MFRLTKDAVALQPNLALYETMYGSTESSTNSTNTLYSTSDVGSDGERIYRIEGNLSETDSGSDSSFGPLTQRNSFASRVSNHSTFRTNQRSRSNSETSQPTSAHWCSFICSLFMLAGGYVIQAFASLIEKIKRVCSRPSTAVREDMFLVVGM